MKKSWKIAFQASQGYSKMPAEKVISSLSGLGYEGIEWTTSHFNPDKSLKEAQKLVDQTRSAGMDVSRIFAHEDLVCLDDVQRQERINRTLRIIELAGECGVSNVGTMTGPAPWNPAAPKIGSDISESAAWEQIFEAYDAFGKAARKVNIAITSEGVFGMLAHDFYTHKFMMDQLDKSVHIVNLDPSHGVLYGNLDAGWIVRQWGKRIGHVHIKDAVGIPEMGKFLFPLIGEGNVDWHVFFKALEDIGYNGFCSVEFESFEFLKNNGGNIELMADISIKTVNSILAGIKL